MRDANWRRSVLEDEPVGMSSSPLSRVWLVGVSCVIEKKILLWT